MEEKDKKTELNEKQKLFCINYASNRETFANGVQSYATAYNIDLDKPGGYNTARSNSYQLLTNTYILEYINELLDLEGLNDSYVDKQLLFVITQNADMGSKVAAMREYNKLKNRITDKLDVNIKGNIDITLNLE